MLFCRGVHRQHRTEWLYFVSSRNLFSSSPWKMVLRVLPSTTRPIDGVTVVGKENSLMPKTFHVVCELTWAFFTSSNVISNSDSQVSYEKTIVQGCMLHSTISRVAVVISVANSFMETFKPLHCLQFSMNFTRKSGKSKYTMLTYANFSSRQLIKPLALIVAIYCTSIKHVLLIQLVL